MPVVPIKFHLNSPSLKRVSIEDFPTPLSPNNINFIFVKFLLLFIDYVLNKYG